MDKKLYRSSKNRIIGGVCGGLAEYFNMDPSLVRILWVLFTLISCFIGAILYLACLLIIPLRN